MSTELDKLLKEVRDLKNILLPDPEGDLGSIRYSTWYKPNISGGGDYFDVIRIEQQENGFGIMMADVSGHGAGAAMEAVMLDAILRTSRSYVINGPADVFNYVNPHLFSKRLRGNFISAFACNLMLDKGLLAYVNAGHPPALAITLNGEIACFDNSCHIPLCIDSDHVYKETVVPATDYKFLIFYTDGVLELKTADDSQIGLERFKAIVQRSSSLEDIQSQVSDLATIESLENSDDITVLFIEVV